MNLQATPSCDKTLPFGVCDSVLDQLEENEPQSVFSSAVSIHIDNSIDILSLYLFGRQE